jgi:hypothetical protein
MISHAPFVNVGHRSFEHHINTIHHKIRDFECLQCHYAATTAGSFRGRLHVQFHIRFSVRFACKSDAHPILCSISRPTPIDPFPPRTRNCRRISRSFKFGETHSYRPCVRAPRQQGIGWKIGRNKIARVDAQFSCRTANRISI